MELEKELVKAFEVKELKENSYQIKTSAFYPNGVPIFLFLDKTKNGYALSDKKQTLKFMSYIYALNSPDIKTCIKDVLALNKILSINGILAVEITDVSKLVPRIFDMLMCIGQLVNMRAFFEDPNNN